MTSDVPPAPLSPPAALVSAPWIADRGDGTYQNPVLFADYSDPDVVRVGDDFYLVSSSFHHAPGLPLLHSRDLVNWTLLHHVLARPPPEDHFSLPRHGQGVWAPAIRHHDGRFWLYYPDPDFGIYVTTAIDPAGTWTPPVLVRAGKGLIDPCPFWDDDGTLHLIHGWARSRSGIGNFLTLHRLSPDGTRVLDAGEIVIDGDKLPGFHTLEGPKLYKRGGYYYVFAPAGGVATGYQAVFRSKNIRGPYDHRIVLEQGTTRINGPHQGAWIDTPSGEHWFMHFQDRGPYGRVVHLQPMRWDDDWPVIGLDADGEGKGEPVLLCTKPAVSRPPPITAPATSDEFDQPALGLQWQWNANPGAEWSSLTARPGWLRLLAVPVPATRNDGTPARNTLYDAPHLLLQKFMAPAFTAETVLEFSPRGTGECAGLIVFGYDYAWIGLRRDAAGIHLVHAVNRDADKPGAEERLALLEELADATTGSVVRLRVTVDDLAGCVFAYSLDGGRFLPVAGSFTARVDRWVGAKVGLFASAPAASGKTGYADFAWFHVTPPVR